MPVAVAPSTSEPQVLLDPVSIMHALSPMVRTALDEIGMKAVTSIRESLSTPVGHGQGHIIRSKPGEAPRMETGALERGIDYEVITDNELPALDVTAHRSAADGDADAARVLEDGGLNSQGNYVEPRPYMAPEAELMRVYAVRIISEHLSAGHK